jgi:hypothetical protein
LRLLVSVRDTGAAAHLTEIIPALRDAPDMAVTLVAQEPALSLLRQRGCAPEAVHAEAIADCGDSNVSQLRQAARQLVEAIQPDALLVGLSGPGLGIDEALLAETPGVPSYALQDYPGWVVEGFGVKPGTYFVTDQRAAEMTERQLSGCHTVIVGSAKHAAYSRIDPLALRKASRIKSEANGPLVCFYGQPVWFLPGYTQALSSLACALAQIGISEINYRPHPKETANNREQTTLAFSAAGVALRNDPNETAEQSLCAADLVVTCFSSCGADQIYLQKRAPAPLGSVLYLFTEPDLRRHHAEHAGSDIPPFANPAELPEYLRRGLDPATPRTLWSRIRQDLPDPSAAPNLIVAAIRKGHEAYTAPTVPR